MAMNSGSGNREQGAAATPPKRQEGRKKSFEQVKYPPFLLH